MVGFIASEEFCKVNGIKECAERNKDDPNCLGMACKAQQCWNALQRCRCEHYLDAEKVCSAAKCECQRGQDLDNKLCQTNPVGDACKAECKCPPSTHVDNAACMNKCNKCRNNAIANCYKKVQQNNTACLNKAQSICNASYNSNSAMAGICDVTIGYGECLANSVPKTPSGGKPSVTPAPASNESGISTP